MNFYVDYINLTVMTKIDHVRLQADYATKEKAYVKSAERTAPRCSGGVWYGNL